MYRFRYNPKRAELGMTGWCYCGDDLKTKLPDEYEVQALYTAPPAAVLPEELYRIANHIASSKAGLPDEWQSWIDEIENDIRRAYQPVKEVVPAFVTHSDLAALHRFNECCEDPESGGHDLEKGVISKLEYIGALQRSGRVSYITAFGEYLLSITVGFKWREAE